MKIFNLVKGIFGKPASAPDPEVELSADSEPVESGAETVEYAAPAQFMAAAEKPPVPVQTSPELPPVDASSSEISMPLSSIVASLPVELQQRVRSDVIGVAVCAFPLDKILPQLSQGLVRVTFGELRQSAPEAFTTGSDRDFVMISLPLNELIGRLAPAMFGRSPRKQIEVPEEIVSPFGPRGQGLAFGKRTSDTSLTSRPRGAQSTVPVRPATGLPARGNTISMPQPAAPGGTTVFIRKPATPPPNGVSLPPTNTPSSTPPIGTVPMGGGFHKPPIAPSSKPINGNGSSNDCPVPSVAQPVAARISEASPISISFAALGETLPEALRLEAGHLNLDGARLALPVDQVEAGLKSGKLVFTWKQLRAWIKPTVPAAPSAHDNLVVTLPLNVIAPLFLGRHKAPGSGQKRVLVDEKIPNLFFGFPQPAAAPDVQTQQEIPVLPVPKPAETNYFVWDDEKEQPQLETSPAPSAPKAAPTPGTTFASRKATPNEVVTKASLLEGVYGALVALPDGLLVAAKLDPAVNGETIAALIPQMYSKLSGCTKELRMGELNNLNFTVGNLPWKIFRVNGLFFAAFGCAGEPLPTAHLAELAAALDYRKTQ